MAAQQPAFTAPPGQSPLPWGASSRLNYRGFASRIFSPFEEELASLGDVYPFAFVLFDTARDTQSKQLVSQGTARGYTSQPYGCWITHLVGNFTPTGGAGVVVQVYDTLRKQIWNPNAIIGINFYGTAQEPLWLKHIYALPPNMQLQTKVTNLQTSTLTGVQIVAWGVRPRRKAAR